jgi:hypothetical protein
MNNQDEDKSLAWLRAKACIQSLGFSEWRKFKEVCAGAVLESRLNASAPGEIPIKFSYEKLREELENGFLGAISSSIWGPPTGHRFKHVCAVRDYFRNNNVFWLTVDFQKDGGVVEKAHKVEATDIFDSNDTKPGKSTTVK